MRSVRDLPQAMDLDRHSLSRVRGGNAWLRTLGPVANVDVDINQNIVQGSVTRPGGAGDRYGHEGSTRKSAARQ